MSSAELTLEPKLDGSTSSDRQQAAQLGRNIWRFHVDCPLYRPPAGGHPVPMQARRTSPVAVYAKSRCSPVPQGRLATCQLLMRGLEGWKHNTVARCDSPVLVDGRKARRAQPRLSLPTRKAGWQNVLMVNGTSAASHGIGG